MRRCFSFAFALVLAASTARAEPRSEATATFGSARAATTITVLGTTDVAQFAPLLDAFVAATPEVAVAYEQWGSNELYLRAAAACGGQEPAADLVISSAADLQVKLVNDGCARAHHSLPVASLPDAANWRNELFGVTEEPAVIVYNRTLVPASEVPRSRFDLIDMLRPDTGRYTGRVATYDIEDSGLGYLFAFADSQQAATWGSLIEAFARSGAVATCCSAEIIDGVASGRYFVAYNVLGSYALARAAADPRLAVVAPEDYTLVLRRAAMIPKQAQNPAAAGLLVDFMLSDAGRVALAASHLLFPFDDADTLPPDEVSLYRPIALAPTLLLGLDQQKRASFLARWRAVFARS
ncbi:MAG: ABC transporter substrate-binding protein [Amaricoccus sp.]|uniref:ABC transporter substrate-binding protein n=1 Tax=Amaricoccus sp. TaxID=1872485 RepID=UPI0039E5D643